MMEGDLRPNRGRLVSCQMQILGGTPGGDCERADTGRVNGIEDRRDTRAVSPRRGIVSSIQNK